MAWVHDLPPGMVALITKSLFVGLSVAGLFVTRRWSQQRGLHALVDNGVIGWIFSAFLGTYAIAIGLVAVASWSDLPFRGHSGVSPEAYERVLHDLGARAD